MGRVELLVALAEVLANQGMGSDGAGLIEKYRRHSAFKQETKRGHKKIKYIHREIGKHELLIHGYS